MKRSNSHRASDAVAAPRAGEAGFTLIELAVAMVVLLLAVLLACDLLSESGRLLHHSVRRARDPWTLLAAELLRNDLRGAKTPQPLTGWQVGRALRLETAEGVVTWQRMSDGRLARKVLGGNIHVYLQGVRDFRWQLVEGNAIEVWARYHVSSPYLRQLAGSLPRTDPGEDHDLHLLVVLRGNPPGAQSW